MKHQEEIRIFFATTLITSWNTTRDGADALISSKLAHLLPAMKTLYKLTQTLQLADEAQSWTFSSFHGLKYTGKNRLQSTGFLEALVQEKLKVLQSLPKNQPETIITLISQALQSGGTDTVDNALLSSMISEDLTYQKLGGLLTFLECLTDTTQAQKLKEGLWYASLSTSLSPAHKAQLILSHIAEQMLTMQSMKTLVSLFEDSTSSLNCALSEAWSQRSTIPQPSNDSIVWMSLSDHFSDPYSYPLDEMSNEFALL